MKIIYFEKMPRSRRAAGGRARPAWHILPLLALLAGQGAHAYPGLSRHGYFNCTACHVSPSGGGHLTAYGRQLSAELLSGASRPGEEKAFYGLLPESEHLSLQAYLKAVQIFTDSKSAREAEAVLMQADLEAALRAGRLTAVGAVGRRKIRDGSGEHGQPFSRTHYLLWSHESGLGIRGGRFAPSWGLNHPNHFLLVRRDLGLGGSTERYAAEISFLADGWSVLAAHVFGNTVDKHAASTERAETVSFNKAIGEASRVGAGYYRGFLPGRGESRDLAALYGLAFWGRGVFSLGEATYQWKRAARPQAGAVASHQLCWEITQGLIPYLEMQWEQLRRGDSAAAAVSGGLGVSWFPRPHWDLLAFAGKEQSGSRPPTAIFYFTAGFYL